VSIDLSPMGLRKTPFTRELAVAERFQPLMPSPKPSASA